jgi:hypothetical protein
METVTLLSERILVDENHIRHLLLLYSPLLPCSWVNSCNLSLDFSQQKPRITLCHAKT